MHKHIDNSKWCGVCGQPLTQAMKPTVLYGWSVDKACSKSFNQKRVNAVVVDFVSIFVIMFTIDWFLPSSTFLSPDGGLHATSTIALLVAATLILAKDSWYGISLGKRMTGLQVVDSDTGKPIGIRQSIQRNLLLLSSLCPWVLPERPAGVICTGLWITAYRMRLGPRDGDGWANTKVIVRDQVKAPAFAPPRPVDVRQRSLAA